MPTNDFIGFASAGSANIMSQANYAAAAEQTDGVQPGPASAALANKIWRQGANMASAIGEIIKAQGYDAFDNGDIAALSSALLSAFSTIFLRSTETNISNNGYIRFNNRLQIIWGSESVLSGQETTGIAVSFTKPFSNAPRIFTTVSFAAAYGYAFTPQPISQSSTGFTCVISSSKNGTAVGYTNGSFSYLAFGPWA